MIRVVSFLPSITELLYELGAEDNIVGVTHECTYPERAKKKLRVIDSIFNPNKMTSKQIDDTVSRIKKNGQSVFVVVEENLRAARPDLIIGQGTCAVCSAYTQEVSRALEILENTPQIEILDPHTIDDILESVTYIAEKIGKEKEGHALRKSLERRLVHIRSKNITVRPRVLCIEWVDPFFTAGHWIPQMVEYAGGVNLVSATGQRSVRMTMDEVEKADPDIIIMMPCGFDAERTKLECHTTLKENQRWKNLRAVRGGNVYSVDANSYFSKPSIRTIVGVEILGKIIHPNEFADLSVPADSFKRL
ncbi:MAG: cobalamin-binding protein [Candidatus Nitrosotenuis sp.]